MKSQCFAGNQWTSSGFWFTTESVSFPSKEVATLQIYIIKESSPTNGAPRKLEERGPKQMIWAFSLPVSEIGPAAGQYQASTTIYNCLLHSKHVLSFCLDLLPSMNESPTIHFTVVNKFLSCKCHEKNEKPVCYIYNINMALKYINCMMTICIASTKLQEILFG